MGVSSDYLRGEVDSEAEDSDFPSPRFPFALSAFGLSARD